MTRIFISYSRVDKNFVKNLTELLGHSFDHVWYDTAKLVGGDTWWAKILQQIEICDHFIYLLSSESIASEWCQKELEEAMNLEKHIVPIRIRDRTNIPDNLKGLHVIDMFDEVTRDGINQIYASIIRSSSEVVLASETGEKVRTADLKLLVKLWPFIRSSHIVDLAREFHGRGIRSDSLFYVYDVYLNELRVVPENEFQSSRLRIAINEFDETLRNFYEHFAPLSEANTVNDELSFVRANFKWSNNPNAFEQLSDAARQVYAKYSHLVTTVKLIYPDFDFSIKE